MAIDKRALERWGAIARMTELRSELAELEREYGGKARQAGPAKPLAAVSASVGQKKRKPMSPAQRKAVGERMKAFWANKRKAKKG